MSSSFYVYLLICSDNTSYVGATVDLDRRLRQHNGEIKGGAHMTSMKLKQGKSWHRACYVSGFPTWQSALQFEWRWKQLTRKLNMAQKPIRRRFSALRLLLSLDRSTTKATPFIDWETPPEIIFENEEDKLLYEEHGMDTSVDIVLT